MLGLAIHKGRDDISQGGEGQVDLCRLFKWGGQVIGGGHVIKTRAKTTMIVEFDDDEDIIMMICPFPKLIFVAFKGFKLVIACDIVIITLE